MILIDKIRERLFGRCPECNSLKSKGVKGWQKRECKDCGHIWIYKKL